ncbi:MAG: hypothetical protein ACM3IH_19620 [Sphingobacteriales bacterium]|jgi:hypothetical protein
MKLVLLMMIRNEPVAASKGVGMQASNADTARMAEQNFMTRIEPSIIPYPSRFIT